MEEIVRKFKIYFDIYAFNKETRTGTQVMHKIGELNLSENSTIVAADLKICFDQKPKYIQEATDLEIAITFTDKSDQTSYTPNVINTSVPLE